MARGRASRTTDDGAARRYTPLFSGLVAMLLAVLVLPSALNVPQSNPTQTLEFAPVPPDDEAPPPPPAGNTASLGLGTSSSAPGDALGGEGGPPPPLPPPPLPDGDGATPVTKRCVGNPPRQTEDPLSPPCVAHFDGDNFGATYRGVDVEEITILFYLDAQVWSNTDRGSESEPQYEGRYFDLGRPAEERETVTLRNLRRFQQYFNDRFQVYGRTARFHAYFAISDQDARAKTPESRRADALDNLEQVRPFAVLTTGTSGAHEEPYVQTMADAGVMVFGSQRGVQPAAFFQRFEGLAWSYLPTVEKQAELFATYACEQVVGRPVVDSGNAGENGGPRTLGFLSTTDERKPHLVLYAREIKRRLEACGATFEHTATFPQAGAATQTRNAEDPAALYASRNVASFQQAGVTTVIWAGGYEADHSKAAARAGYLPEWIVAGDGQLEGDSGAGLQDQEAWDHAWVATTAVRVVEDGADPCRAALREADPSIGSGDEGWGCSASYYRDLRQLFTGIQVAGPRLTPETMEQGFRAIPQKASTDATVPACFYEPGDYTCVKDATAEWWDPTGQDDGCYRMIEVGRRYLAGTWPATNIDGLRRDDDPCNLYSSSVLAF